MAKQSVDLSWGREASFYPSDADPPKSDANTKETRHPAFVKYSQSPRSGIVKISEVQAGFFLSGQVSRVLSANVLALLF